MTEHQDWKWWKDEAYKAAARADAAEKRWTDYHTLASHSLAVMTARAEAAEKREAVLRKAIERVLTGREVYKGDHTEVESYDTGTIEDILSAALEAKP